MRRLHLGVVVLSLTVAGCEQDETRPNFEYAPDMVSSVPFDTFAANPVTVDGKTLLAPVKGTVPRGYQPLHRPRAPRRRHARGGSSRIRTRPLRRSWRGAR
ncbi:hypothetical protein QEG98_30470 [Myxococcus sp. MxC21-1]|uniref:hypothetical protein n=1 Tax=Myxococcus sp. MxC21-1 TaxID=3041439 RepID=UPI00292DBCDF|nr:hypothetical protein [Myxococcus sp. MxC21-1]WNZ60295.1 hypothetical protein QEG98_30470 [Myxococcus sp. MxC21-1]